MTWEHLLALAPLYAALTVALLKMYQRRNGNGRDKEGKHNPSPEFHGLVEKVDALNEKVSNELSTLGTTAAVLTERVGRIDTRTETLGRRLHAAENHITILLLKVDME